MNDTTLEQAMEILGVEIITTGSPERPFAYYAEEDGQAYWLTQDDLDYAATLAADPDEDIRHNIYSHWCAATGERMAETDFVRFYGGE